MSHSLNVKGDSQIDRKAGDSLMSVVEISEDGKVARLVFKTFILLCA
jgi:hypothetical protein